MSLAELFSLFPCLNQVLSLLKGNYDSLENNNLLALDGVCVHARDGVLEVLRMVHKLPGVACIMVV